MCCAAALASHRIASHRIARAHAATVMLMRHSRALLFFSVCVRAQKWLYDANEASAAHIVPPSSFHNDALNEPAWVDAPPMSHAHAHGMLAPPAGSCPLADDFARWLNKDGAFRFSFCAFPFLYAPAAKSRIVAIERTERQREAFSAALLRALFQDMGAGGGLPMLVGGGFGGAAAAGADPFCVLRVRRATLLSDAARELRAAAAHLHKPLKVMFVGEEGVDEGGVQKEFFALTTRAIFSPDYGMFAPPDGAGRLTWFSPGGLEVQTEDEYELVGTLLGLALYNGHLVELALPRVAYKLLLGGAPVFADLADAAPELHAGLSALLAHAPPESVADTFGLTWTAGYECCGATRTAELAPGGADVAVTGDNRAAYVDAYAHWFLSAGVARQAEAFRRGFRAVASPAGVGAPGAAAAAAAATCPLSLLRPEELEALLCGAPDLDFDALEAGARYGEGLSPSSPQARAFWRVAHALPERDKKRLLAFVTASDRVPIGGLGALPFALVRNGEGDERLPTAHTCFNTLLLPHYSSEEVLRARLALALDNAEGFGLR
jgi:hypothetical protein